MLKLCVLTGDPRLPDPTKRDHRYNDEDFATHAGDARRRCESLHGLRASSSTTTTPGCSSASPHDPPDLVINFCDTGFRNVATQELHVPALLELLGVPYSGASPACMVLCYDKQIVRLLAEALGIPVPREVFLGRTSRLRRRRALCRR